MMNFEETQNFIKNNVFEIKGEILSSCIDGRYQVKDSIKYPRSLAGADAGWLLIVVRFLKELKLLNDFNYDKNLVLKIFNNIVDLVGGIKNFMVHTDSNYIDEGIVAGCGHMKSAQNNFNIYGLEKDDINLILDFLIDLQKKGLKQLVLKGDHQEGAIFIIHNKNIGLLHQNNNKQAFVFHKALYEEFLDKLVSEFKKMSEFNLIEKEKMKKMILKIGEEQLNKTIQKLASGLPIYNINLDANNNPIII